MTLSREQQKTILIALVSVLALLIIYRFMTREKPKTVPLTYARGAVARSPVRQGLASQARGGDPLSMFLARREEKFPGVSRDIFRMENPAPKPKPKPKGPVQAALPLPPPPPVKTPEELAAEAAAAAARAAAEAARAELSRFRFLGYLTERESKLFLSKDGELFIVKNGDLVQKSYKVKEAGREYVVLLDTVTSVEVRVELSGGGETPPQQPMIIPPRFQ